MITDGEIKVPDDVKRKLFHIGCQLDEGIFPRVYNGGVIKSGDAPVVSSMPETRKETDDVPGGSQSESRQSRKRPRSRSRTWPRSRSPREAARIGRNGLRALYKAQIRDLELAYPGTICWEAEGGMWLLIKSAVIEGLDRHATFLIALPDKEKLGPRAWAFWTRSGDQAWIGRRHTNFPDGSVCAFSPLEGVWLEGGRLDELVDLYSVWALRHLFLEQFKRWPGAQHTNSRLYRMIEFQPDELCSCPHGLRYADCCHKSDLASFVANPAAFKRELENATGGYTLNDRSPPRQVVEFVDGILAAPPAMADVLVH